MKDLDGEMRLVLFDHRGHGRSARPPTDDFSLEALARDLDAVIRDASSLAFSISAIFATSLWSVWRSAPGSPPRSR